VRHVEQVNLPPLVALNPVENGCAANSPDQDSNSRIFSLSRAAHSAGSFPDGGSSRSASSGKRDAAVTQDVPQAHLAEEFAHRPRAAKSNPRIEPSNVSAR